MSTREKVARELKAYRDHLYKCEDFEPVEILDAALSLLTEQQEPVGETSEEWLETNRRARDAEFRVDDDESIQLCNIGTFREPVLLYRAPQQDRDETGQNVQNRPEQQEPVGWLIHWKDAKDEWWKDVRLTQYGKDKFIEDLELADYRIQPLYLAPPQDQEALKEIFGTDRWGPEVMALADTVRNRRLDYARWDDLNALYHKIVRVETILASQEESDE